MRPSEYKKLEGDKEFKRHYMKKTMWWKSFLFVAPTALMFVGLAGILHMAYSDKIFTWYAAPYIVVFALGTIWLKAIKKHVQNKMLEDKKRYLACAGKSIGNKSGRYYFIFSKDSKRHNEDLISKLANELKIDSFTDTELKLAKTHMVEIKTSEKETPIYLKAVKANLVLKANRENIGSGIIPLLYISKKNIFVIRNKDLR